MGIAKDKDRLMWALAGLMRSEVGGDYVRDAISDELVREIGELVRCGDLAAIGPAFAKAMLADRDISNAIEAEHERSEAQIEMALHTEAMANAPTWWRSFDRETGIAVAGEI